MYASKFADPEAVIPEISEQRRKVSRQENVAPSSVDSQPLSPVKTPSSHRRQPSKAVDASPSHPLLPRPAEQGRSFKPNNAAKVIEPPEAILNWGDSTPPLPHVAETVSTLPEPPIILRSSPASQNTQEVHTLSPKEPIPSHSTDEEQASAGTTEEPAIQAPQPVVHEAVEDSMMNETTAAAASQIPTPSAAPEKAAAALTADVVVSTPPVLPETSETLLGTEIVQTPAVAFKARRSKRGKPCAVRIPKVSDKLYAGFTAPMTTEENARRLEHFQDLGYDTRGYVLWDHGTHNAAFDEEVQGRAIYPDPTETFTSAFSEKPAVSIPDKKLWDDYVNYLTEEKLRRLGVTTGDEPAPPPLSSQVSSPYPPLPFSPPIPGSSAASHQTWQQNNMPFSAPFSPAISTNQTSVGGFMPPSPSLAQIPRPGQITRQPSHGLPFPPGHGPVIRSLWSPQQTISSNNLDRGGSPAIVPDFQKPLPTLPKEASQSESSVMIFPAHHKNPRPESTNSQARDQKDTLNGAVHAQLAPSNDHFGEVASPQPQGHRTNLSATLEREAEQYYPGEYVHGERVPPSQPLPINYSASGKPLPVASAPFVNPWNGGYQAGTSQISNKSTPQLNVDAKEFKFNLQSTHARTLSKPKDTFLPVAPVKPAKPGDATSAVSLATAHSRQGSVTLSHLNVAAPEFKPPTSKNFAFSTGSWFNLSKNPSVDPLQLQELNKPSSEEERKTSSNIGSKIFGNLADIIIMPPKKSKAVPIVNPGEVSMARTTDAFEDGEDGRPARPEGRSKKGRYAANDGDEVPRFAEPTPEPEPLLVSTPPASAKTEQSPAIVTASAPAPKSEGVTFAAGLPLAPTETSTPVLKPTPVPASSVQTKPRTLELEYELDLTGNTSDASTVPWHGIEGEQKRSIVEKPLQETEESLLASSPPSSGAEDAGDLTDKPTSSQRQVPNTSHLPYSDSPKESEDIIYPTFKGANDVLDYINDDNSDFGFDDAKLQTPLTPAPKSAFEPISVRAEPLSINRDLFSPSPERREQRTLANLGEIQASERFNNNHGIRASASPVRRLNKMTEVPVSDWDDMLSSGQELQIPQQNKFSDARIATLVEGLLKRHLAPFEKTLDELSSSLKRGGIRDFSRDPRPVSSYEKSNSDADDEDDLDEEGERRQREVKTDRRLSQIRNVVKEALNSAQSSGSNQIEQEVRIRKAAEHRADDAQRLLALTEKEIELYKEASAIADEKIRGLEEERTDASRHYKAVEEELRAKTLQFTAEIATLENTLDEYRSSSAKWKEDIDSVTDAREKLQKIIDSLKAEADESSKERIRLTERIVKAEEELLAAQKTFSEERSALELTAEKRVRDVQYLQAQVNEASILKQELATATKALAEERAFNDREDDKHVRELDNLQSKLDEANNLKQKLGAEIDRLTVKDKEAIRANVMLEETQAAKSKLESFVQKMTEKSIEHQTIVARYEREASEAREETAMQVQRTRSLMETDVEIANKKVDNIRADLGTRLEMARKELENVRRDHDAVRGRYERSLNETNASRKEALQEANTTHFTRLKEERERFDQRLEEMSDQHNRALRNALHDKQRSEDSLNSQLELAHAKIAQLNDKVTLAERRAKEIDVQANERAALSEQRISATRDAIAATEKRAKDFDVAANERVSLVEQRLTAAQQAADEKVVSLKQRLAAVQEAANERVASVEQRLSVTEESAQQKVSLMEERLSVAQSAAQAAIAAAQSAKTAAVPTKTTTVENASSPAGPTRTIAIPTHLEKISPQALRESIVVLQEQLQEREARIERLETEELAPVKLREKESEITWLREILGVRMDDLTDLVNNLQMEKFDRGAARNAAIRIKANLQMEQHERDRAQGVVRTSSPAPAVTLPSLTDIKNFASPQAAQLTAAWASFKKGPPSLSGFREAQNASTPTRPGPANRQSSANFSISAAAAGARAPLVPAAGSAPNSVANSTGFRPTNPMAAAAASNAKKNSDAQSILSGLMTPPASKLRRTPSISNTARPSGPNTARPRTPSRTMSRSGVASLSSSPEKAEKANSGRSATPPLLRKGDYDLDAELGGQDVDFQEEEEEGSERTVTASPVKRVEETMERTRLEPLGEVLAADEA